MMDEGVFGREVCDDWSAENDKLNLCDAALEHYNGVFTGKNFFRRNQVLKYMKHSERIINKPLQKNFRAHEEGLIVKFKFSFGHHLRFLSCKFLKYLPPK